MARKYSSWASNQPLINPDLSMMRLTTVMGNEQDQLKHLDRVEAIPHMYINVDAPPPPSSARMDARAIQPAMISRQNSSYFAAPSMRQTPINVPTKIWPVEQPSKNASSFENASSTSKRHHKHKHHHHHHHGDKHHHHRHHNRRHRARSAETIRNRQHQTLLSSSKVMLGNPQYIEQDQQQQQQQPMIVYREIPNGEGYTVDPNGLATVPYGTDNETNYGDDQQAPMFVYRDANQQQQQQIMSDGISQQYLFNQDQDTFIQQTDPFMQQPSQIVYCTDPNHQEYLCPSTNNNMIQQSFSPQQQQQQQFVCLDNTPTTIQPTIINQIPVFNPLSTNQTSQSILNVPQTSLQRTTSFVIQQPQIQSQPLQIVQQQQPLQILQQPQQLQVIQQPQQLQLIQQPQPLQIIQNPQGQSGQIVQLASAQPQMIQTIQPQLMQAQPLLQTIQMPAQTVAATPQILYQRPYDPVLVPIQNQQMAMANHPLVALSQPSYAPSRILPATAGIQQPGANMFRHALLRTVADRAVYLFLPASTGGLQLIQPAAAAASVVAASNPNLLVAGGLHRSASLPIIPLTPGGILIPFQPSQTPGLRPGPLPRAGGYPTNLHNFTDIRQRMQQRRDQLFQSLQQATYGRIPSPPVLAPAPRNPFASGPRPGGTPFPPLTPGTYTRLPSPGLAYSQPSFAGSARSATSAPYNPFRP